MADPIEFISRVLNKFSEGSDLHIRPHLCARVRYPRSGCRLCQDACPVHAIHLSEDTVSFKENCTRCEICIPSCPNGVFVLSDDQEASRRRLFRESHTSGSVMRITCAVANETERQAGFVFPCLAAIPVPYLMSPLSRGVEVIEIKRIDCGNCTLSSGMNQYRRHLMETLRFLSCFGFSPDCILEVGSSASSENDSLKETGPTQKKVGRREFFGLFRKSAVETTKGLIPEAEESHEDLRWYQQQSPHRSFFLEVIRHLNHPLETNFINQTLPLSNLRISPDCIGCNVCEKLCPTGAIHRVEEKDKAIRLYFNLSKCTGCKICGEACLPKAISFSKSIDLKELIEGKDQERILVSARHCKTCGNLFQGLPGTNCSQCIGHAHTS